MAHRGGGCRLQGPARGGAAPGGVTDGWMDGAVPSRSGRFVLIHAELVPSSHLPTVYRVADGKPVSQLKNPFTRGWDCGGGQFLDDEVLIAVGRTCDEYPSSQWLAAVATGKGIAPVAAIRHRDDTMLFPEPAMRALWLGGH